MNAKLNCFNFAFIHNYWTHAKVCCINHNLPHQQVAQRKNTCKVRVGCGGAKQSKLCITQAKLLTQFKLLKHKLGVLLKTIQNIHLIVSHLFAMNDIMPVNIYSMNYRTMIYIYVGTNILLDIYYSLTSYLRTNTDWNDN